MQPINQLTSKAENLACQNGQQKPEDNGNGKTLTPKLLINLWERMTHIYGHRWTSAYGEAAVHDGELSDTAKTWASGLRGVTGDQLADGLRACVERVDPWPPSLPEFVALCKGKNENGFKLDYTPQVYRQEKRPERLLEPSDELKQARRDAAAKGIKAMREKIATSKPEEPKPDVLFEPLSQDERDFRLMVLLHTLRADYPVARRLKVVRGYV